MGVEFLAPRGARVGEQDVHVLGVLGYLSHEVFHAFEGGAVGGDRDRRLGPGVNPGEGVEDLDGFCAGGGFPGGDEYL